MSYKQTRDDAPVVLSKYAATNEVLFKSFGDTLHGLAAYGANWEHFDQLEKVYNRKVDCTDTGMGARGPLIIRRSDALWYEVHLDWLDWRNPKPDGTYNHHPSTYMQPQSVTIMRAKSYDATMVDFVYNFLSGSFEVWFNTEIASTTTKRHIRGYEREVIRSAKHGRKHMSVGDSDIVVPMFWMAMGEYHDMLKSRNRWEYHVVKYFEDSMDNWRRALNVFVVRNTRHRTATAWIRQAREYALMVRRTLTEGLEPLLEEQRSRYQVDIQYKQNNNAMTRWIEAIERTHVEEQFYDLVLEKPMRERKAMLHVFKQLDA